MKTINFDVAQALVNYVARDGNTDSLQWGDLSATKVREKLCELKMGNNRVKYQDICDYFSQNQTYKMIAKANNKLIFLKALMKDASRDE